MTTETVPLRMTGLVLGENDAEAETLGGYLVALIECGLEAKRPFGNSGWRYDLYGPMIKAGLIKGKLDEDGYVDEVDIGAGDRLITQALQEIKAEYK